MRLSPRFVFVRSLYSAASTAIVLLAAQGTAFAQQANPRPNCPPGSWFCADATGQASGSVAIPPAAQAPSNPSAPQYAPPLAPLPPLPSQAPPPAAPLPPLTAPPVAPPPVVYQPMPRPIEPRPQVYYYAPRPALPYPNREEWGLNVHLQAALIGKGTNSSSDASMGGPGIGLRYKPNSYVGLEGDFDYISGRDYLGMRRRESALSINGLVFLNPRSRAQVYVVAGLGHSSATVTNDFDNFSSSKLSYSYVGGQVGVGLEWRLASHFALNGDLRGFVRTRVDKDAEDRPEFIDSNGRTTNTSGGGLFTAGMTFYF